jgi:CheY-like chemotaxis protein
MGASNLEAPDFLGVRVMLFSHVESVSAGALAHHILLVEDDEKVRELVSCSLQSLGYRVMQAVNGRDALRVLEDCQVPIDLLLTDVVMPEMSGSQLADIFTRRNGSARVLFVSGYTNDEVLRRGVMRAEAAFLHKPFTLSALAAKVRESLNAE